MTELSQALDLAVRYHRTGDFRQAEQLYRHILRADPHHADALHMLGLLAHHVGRNDMALDYIKRSLALKPDCAQAHNNLGVALRALGRLTEAIAGYREALRLDPAYAEAHNNLGNTLMQLGSLDEAAASLREALRLQPDYAAAHSNLGIALKEQGKLDEAARALREARRLQPGWAEVQNNLALVLAEQGRDDEAIACWRDALRFSPESVEVHNNLGNAFTSQGKLDDALCSLREALRLHTNSAVAHNNLGNVFKAQGKLADAVASYQKALQFQPDYPEAHKNLGLAWLLMGELERGWPEYEWRWQCKEFTRPALTQPLWDGTELAGRSILLQAEQGLGDSLQFVRYAALVQERGGRVLLRCPRRLMEFLKGCAGIDRLISTDEDLPEFAVYAPLLSLPGIFRTTLATVPVPAAYLYADPRRVESWREELSDVTGFKIGIAWQGNRSFQEDRFRSMPLRCFAPLAEVADVQLISLQKGDGAEQVSDVAGMFPVLDLAGRLDESAAFVDTAAVIKNVDLVITSDTSLAHLAGGLGVPVWVALPFVPDWRWLMDRPDSPWYSQMRLFRQATPGEWGPVFARMAAEVGTPSMRRDWSA